MSDTTFTRDGVTYQLRVERGERRLYALHPAGVWHPVSTSEAVHVLGDEVAARVAATTQQAPEGGR